MELIVELLHKSCLSFGDKPAFQVKDTGRWIDYSYRQLWDDSDRIATALVDWGLANGDRAAILAPASPLWVAAYLGSLKANGIVVPIDKELKRGELRHILENCGARVLFSSEEFFDLLRDILPDLPALEKIVLLVPPVTAKVRRTPQLEAVVDDLIEQWRRLARDYHIRPDDIRHIESRAAELRQLLSNPPPGEETSTPVRNLLSTERRQRKQVTIDVLADFQKEGIPPQISRLPGEAAVILYTSGTTGRAKGAILSHANIVSNIRAAIPIFRLDERMHTLSFLPINHVFEQVCGILLPLTVGGTITFAESLKKLGENLAEVKPNFLLGVPAVFRLLNDRLHKNIRGRLLARALFSLPLTRPLIVRKVRATLGGTPTFISGGAALDPLIAKGLMELGMTIYQGYGITETSPVISAEHAGAHRLGSVGLPFPGVEVRIDQPGEEGVGEIWVRGPNVMLGYFNNPVATAEVLTDGWYHTGDLGRIDDDGMLYLCGRVKNLIVTANGKNVYPEEIENELLHSPFIAEVMVYGHKVSAAAEEVYAIIFPNQEAIDRHAQEHGMASMSTAAVEALIRTEVHKAGSNLADYKRIRKFTLREDEFPKTTTRKIKRFAVEAAIDAASPPPTNSRHRPFP